MSALIDLTGKTFGRLTVLERVDSTKYGNSMWKCQCSCNKHPIVYIAGSSLRSGSTQSCGCLRKEIASKTQLKDLTGKTFGRLTVIKRIGTDEYRNAVWECKCGCGNMCYIPGHSLLSGLTKSCGCLRSDFVHGLHIDPKYEPRSPAINLAGKKFGKLTVIERDKSDNHRNATWKCKCDCGNVVIINSRSLLSGMTKSCGCLRKETNTERLTKWKTPEEKNLSNRFSDMKQRCYNPNDSGYKDYGARGIYICDEWLNDPNSFIYWSIENGFRENLTLNRIDNDGPYAPWNCEWTDYIRQANNRRSNVIVEINGESHTIADWARLCGINYSTLNSAFKRGYQIFKDMVLYNWANQTKTFEEQKACADSRGYEKEEVLVPEVV